MAPETTYLITGVNRGIGKGLLESVLLREYTVVIAGVRDPSSAASKALSSLPTGKGSTVLVVKVDSTSATDAASAVKAIKEQHGITKLDVVIANSGIAKYAGLAKETPLLEVRDHFEVNTIGPLVLFQATWELLEAAAHPKFVVISSHAGSIADMENEPFPFSAYGASKTAINLIVRKIHFEHQMIAFTIHPGWVATDLGNAGADLLGIAEAPVKVFQSVSGILAVVDGATKEDTSGTFRQYDGAIVPW